MTSLLQAERLLHLPLTVALATGDLLEDYATYQVSNASSLTKTQNLGGVVLGNNGISDGQFGWTHIFGTTIAICAADKAFVEGSAVTAGTSQVSNGGDAQGEFWIGTCLASAIADSDSTTAPIALNVWTNNGVSDLNP